MKEATTITPITPIMLTPTTPMPTVVGPDQTLIYFVRHGQTTWNLERRFQGQVDVPLSEVGEKQAEDVAAWLAAQPIHFRALYTSDLSRAHQTAQAIGRQLHLTPQPVRALREIDVGEWQGLLGDEVEARWPGQQAVWREQAHIFKMPGGESVREVQARTLEWYTEATETHRGEAIMVVSHGQALSALLAALHGWNLADVELLKQARMANTGVSVVLADHAAGTHRALIMNSLLHLDEQKGAPTPMQPSGEQAAV